MIQLRMTRRSAQFRGLIVKEHGPLLQFETINDAYDYAEQQLGLTGHWEGFSVASVGRAILPIPLGQLETSTDAHQ